MAPIPSSRVRCDPAVEVIAEDELQSIEQLSETLTRISEITFAYPGHAWRSVHAKAHGIVEAELEVLAELPPALAQGLFAKPGHYSMVMRLSKKPTGNPRDFAASATCALCTSRGRQPDIQPEERT